MKARYRALTFTALLLLAGVTLIPARQLSHLEVDTSNQTMSAVSSQGSARMIEDESHRQTLLIAVTADKPFTFCQWQSLSTLATAMGKISGVDGVILPLIKANGWTLQILRRRHPDGAARMQNLLHLLRSTDGRNLGMLVFLAPHADTGAERTQLLAQLNIVLTDHPIAGCQCRMIGLPVVDETVGELIRHDQRWLLPLCTGVIILMLFLIYRTPAGVLAPLTVIGLAVVWTLGTYAWRIRQLNVVTSLLAPVVMILSLATAVHVYEAYRHCRRQTDKTTEAVTIAIRRVWRPCLFSALTTAAGLGSLTCSSIPAVRIFGLYGAIGVLLSFLFGLSIMPLLLLLPWFGHAPAHTHRKPIWMTKLLSGCYHLGCHRKKTVIVTLAGISLLAVVGLCRLHSNTNLIDYLRQDSDLVRTSRFVDQHLIGINALTCRITPDRMTQSDSVSGSQQRQRFLQATARITGIKGLIPGSLRTTADKHALATATGSRINDRTLTWDLTLRVQAIGSRQARKLLATLKDLVQQHFGANTAIQFGGDFYRIITDSDQLVADLLRSFALALTIITILIGIQLRSLRATVMSLVPNVLSVFWIFGAMGLVGIDLSTGTAMIACVVLGLAVDYTIHYLSSFQRTRQHNLLAAIRTTTNDVGPALVVSTLILAAGFGVGVAGSFKPTVYFSLFTALAMLAALFCNLTVMPVLMGIAFFNPRSDKAQCVSEIDKHPRLTHCEEVHVL